MIAALDKPLDFAVVHGYISLGHRLRGLRWKSTVAGDPSGREALVTGASSGIGCTRLAFPGIPAQTRT